MAGSADKPSDTNSPEALGAYFLNFSLENVRSFDARQTLRLTDKEGHPARWTIILGDNGVGKTTLLRGLAATASFSYYRRAGTEQIGRRLAVQPERRFYDDHYVPFVQANWGYFVRDENHKATLACEFIRANSLEGKQDYDFASQLYGPHQVSFTGFTGRVPDIFGAGALYLSALKCYGYGAARRIGGSSITHVPSDFPAASLFNDETPLLNAEEWILQADYRALREQNPRLASLNERIMTTLRTLLREEVSDIRIESKNQAPRVLFKTQYGWVGLHELSLGYKTLIAWMVDFASRMLDRYEEAENPLHQPAVVLIDEIDLHLHPKLQRELITFLTETFPQTQFIATAHSPLIAQAAEDANLVLLKRKGNQVIIDNDPVNIKNWRVDQILTSDLFDVESARSPGTAKLLEERTKILSKRTLSGRDEKRLKALESQIGELPVGETPAEERAFSAIDRIAMILADSQKPTDEDASNEPAK